MNKARIVLLLLAFCPLLACAQAQAQAQADNRSECALAGGSLLTGVVVSPPRYVSGRIIRGKQLSHTRLTLKADQDGQRYDVAMDNVYASGYDQAGPHVPAPLDTIRTQDRLELCGQRYTSGLGIHWVHSNCGRTPSASHPDGWVKVLDTAGRAGPNLEGNTAYCSLFR